MVDGLVKAWAHVGSGNVTKALAAFDALGSEAGMQGFVLYHKALALASVGDFEGAEEIFGGEGAAAASQTRRGVIAHAEILAQLGRHDEAQSVVDAIPENLELVENFDYYDGIRYFKGTLSESALLSDAGLNATFGVAMVHLIEGRTEQATRMLEDLVAGSSQGYWPAETELLELQR